MSEVTDSSGLKIDNHVSLIVNSVSTIKIDMDAVPFDGTVIVHSERGNNDDKEYVLSSPNYAEIVFAFEQIQTEVGDYSHIYLEGIRVNSEGNSYDLYPVLGS